MNEKKLFAIWQDNTTKGYIALTEEQREAINNLPNAGLYIGHDMLTNPSMYNTETPAEAINGLFELRASLG